MGAVSRRGPIRADIFRPETYKALLPEYDAVVDTVGVLLPQPAYKGLLAGDVCAALRGLPALLNPLHKNPRDTYDVWNRESAVTLGTTVAQLGLRNQREIPFLYVSAYGAPPGVPHGYITSKRAAEEELLGMKGLRPLIVRPPFMYDASQKGARDLVKRAVDAVAAIGVVPPPMSTRQVAETCIAAIADSTVRGIV